MKSIISGTGLCVPSSVITNEELVESFNTYVELQNEANKEAIKAGVQEALATSSVEFIEKASGILRRHVIDKDGVLDPKRMRPQIKQRENDEQSVQCQMACEASAEALEMAGRDASDIDMIIVACSNLERAYPAVAVEVQAAIGASGFAYDMNVACSSATFALQAAHDAILNRSARAALVVNPEICSAHLNFRDRDSHFIFGDVCTALVVESEATMKRDRGFEIIGTKLSTEFSNNIRNNFGFLNHCDDESRDKPDKLFVQEGRKVFKEVVPMVSAHILSHLEQLDISPQRIARMWLHQANLSMNQLVAKRVWGRTPEPKEAPIVLDEFANTSSAGSIIAFHQHQEDLSAGDFGIICSFGAGYSVGTVVVQKKS